MNGIQQTQKTDLCFVVTTLFKKTMSVLYLASKCANGSTPDEFEKELIFVFYSFLFCEINVFLVCKLRPNL